MTQIPTIEIVNKAAPSGITRINAADFDPETMVAVGDAPAPMDLTREGIDAMGKVEVRELLEAHGAEVEAGAKVADMREAAKRVIFAGL